MLMATFPMWFMLSLAANVNFSMWGKHLKILITDSVVTIIFSGTLMDIPPAKF